MKKCNKVASIRFFTRFSKKRHLARIFDMNKNVANNILYKISNTTNLVRLTLFQENSD